MVYSGVRSILCCATCHLLFVLKTKYPPYYSEIVNLFIFFCSRCALKICQIKNVWTKTCVVWARLAYSQSKPSKLSCVSGIYQASNQNTFISLLSYSAYYLKLCTILANPVATILPYQAQKSYLHFHFFQFHEKLKVWFSVDVEGLVGHYYDHLPICHHQLRIIFPMFFLIHPNLTEWKKIQKKQHLSTFHIVRQFVRRCQKINQYS